ncbi:MAG: 50S ribosomal protein L24 [Candidatus Anstonellales archaeon]
MHRSKVRKMLYNAPIHIRNKFLNVPVDKALVDKFGKTTRVRIGDVVRIMRGDFAKKEGKVVELNTKRGTVHIEGVVRKNASGKEVYVPIHASKIMLIKRGEDNGK